MQKLSTLPEDWQSKYFTNEHGIWKAASHSAEIRLHPSGAFLYIANRGHDSIACYVIDQVCPSAGGHVPCGKSWGVASFAGWVTGAGASLTASGAAHPWHRSVHGALLEALRLSVLVGHHMFTGRTRGAACARRPNLHQICGIGYLQPIATHSRQILPQIRGRFCRDSAAREKICGEICHELQVCCGFLAVCALFMLIYVLHLVQFVFHLPNTLLPAHNHVFTTDRILTPEGTQSTRLVTRWAPRGRGPSKRRPPLCPPQQRVSPK